MPDCAGSGTTPNTGQYCTIPAEKSLKISPYVALSLLLVALYFIRTFWSTVQNIKKAQKIGLPYLIVPNGIWTAFEGVLFTTGAFRFAVNNLLPSWAADALNDSHTIGRWTARDRVAQKTGGCYLRVNQDGVALGVCDADVVRHIVNNRHQFPKPLHRYRLLTIYGPNIVASDGKDWPRHRHHAAPAFNEKNNNLVWRDALKQTDGMIKEWRDLPHNTPGSDIIVPAPQPYLNKIILQVLASAGFGVDLPYTSLPKSSGEHSENIFEDSAIPPQGYKATFRSVSQYMSLNFRTVIFALAIVPKWIPRALMPVFAPAFEAYADLEKYLNSLIHVAKDNDTKGRGSNNLLQLLVRSNENTGSFEKDYRLSPKELLGDVHIFTVAGFETTATTLRYTLVLLALHPERQRWLREGIKEALKGQPEDPREWSYGEVFPRLVAPLCIMLETLRMYPPVPTVPKWTSTSADIEFDGKTYTLPPGTYVELIISALHYRPEYWGSDVSSFDPKRWDARNKKSHLAQYSGMDGNVAPGLEFPTVHKPLRGSFIPFSDGHRACLGKKFAQVEYVAILTMICREFEVSLAKISPGESEADAERRARGALEASSMVLSLSMAGDVPLSFHPSRI